MLKRIIFDIDNTLIMGMGSSEYIKGYQDVFSSLGYFSSYEKAKELYDILEFYEDEENIYDKDRMLSFINTKLNAHYQMNLIDALNDKIASTWIHDIDTSVLDVLNYLSSKYELYALSNWFTDVQEKRLERMGMLKYFTKVIGTDMVKIKPNSEAFEMAMEGMPPKECLFVGDNPSKNLETPYKLGASVIHFDSKNKNDCAYKKINELKELKDIL